MYTETREIAPDECKTIGQLRVAVPAVDDGDTGVKGCQGIAFALLLGALLLIVGLMVIRMV